MPREAQACLKITMINNHHPSQIYKSHTYTYMYLHELQIHVYVFALKLLISLSGSHDEVEMDQRSGFPFYRGENGLREMKGHVLGHIAVSGDPAVRTHQCP